MAFKSSRNGQTAKDRACRQAAAADEARTLSAELFDELEDFLSVHYQAPKAAWNAAAFASSAALGCAGITGSMPADNAIPGSVHGMLAETEGRGSAGRHARPRLFGLVPAAHARRSDAALSVTDTFAEAYETAEEPAPADVDDFLSQSKDTPNFQHTLQQLIADRQLENAVIYKKAGIDKKFFSKIISTRNYVPKKHTVMALGLALELPLEEYEQFLASAGYAFMPSSRFDLIIKFCVLHQIYNIVNVDVILSDHNEACFAPE